jgi:YHS domain-containing protein
MEVEESTAQWKTTYQGQTYYFCAAGCLGSFQQEPASYVKANTPGQPKQNPALEHLEVLAGMWKVEMVFPADPANIVRGHVSFDWLEEGAFLAMRLPVETTGPQRSIWVIGRDDSVDTYSVLHFDPRGVSRIYQMSLERSEWKMWREAPSFSQRYVGTFSEDKNIITARWEKSGDGTNWEHDFDLTYTRGK